MVGSGGHTERTELCMRIPKDIPLSVYIRRLISRNKIVEFYQTEDWKELRVEVLEDFHYECQRCLEHGKYTRADCVHHVHEVKYRPDLALTKHYVDKDGKKIIQLLPLCNTCHNLEHDKLGKWQRKDMFTNVERW